MNLETIKSTGVFYLSEMGRILRLTRKPRRSEFNDIIKITGLGMVVIGIIGFLVFLLSKLIGSIY